MACGMMRASFVPVWLAALLTVLVALAAPAQADTQDIAAASRSVVRVALVATDGKSAYFVGHGSGVVVAPNTVLTNAHVVELTRSEPDIVLGIIPSEGSKSYGGKVIAYSPGNDLALISFDDKSDLPVATFFASAATDGQQVTAIGYPGAVDRAQGLSLEQIIHPMVPVRTTGTVSTGRATAPFDTILHTAQMAPGNSGGPLVDQCGRVLGLNSFGTVSQGNDPEYGFAVSDREIFNFLHKAGIKFRQTIEPCHSLAEINAAQQMADQQARSQTALAAREKAAAEREHALEALIARREDLMALATLLLVLGVAGATVAVMDGKNEEAGSLVTWPTGRLRWLAGGAGVVLVIGAVALFVLRPGFEQLDGPAAEGKTATDGAAKAATVHESVGDNLCRIDNALSRVTVSDTSDVPLDWSSGGCINGKTQMVHADGRWTRILVPNDEASISVRSFDPVTGTYRAAKYLVGADTADKARTLRKAVTWQGCTADPQKLAALEQMQDRIESVLPDQPNERLVYHCSAHQDAAKP